MKSSIKLVFATILFAGLFFTSCTKEEQREFSVQMTDAPIDDQSVEAVFITVSSVKIDGQTFSGFTGRQTFDVKALQKGMVKVLGTGNLDAKAYSNVSVVLDLDTDANGNPMGCYIQHANGTKESLAGNASGTIEIVCNKSIDLAAETRSKVDCVLDFDIRKAIKRNANNSYEFVSSTELSSSIRAVIKHKTGTIKGHCNDNSSSNNDKVIAYVYPRGSYTSAEQNAQGSGNIRFKNAISSCEVDNNGDFQLSFLYSGKYDVVFAAYDYNSENEASFKGMIEVGGALSGDLLGGATVQAGITTNIELSFSSIL